MKRSGLLLVSLSGAFVLTGLGLMVVSAEDKELYRDLTNAVQHIDEVKFTHTGSNPIDATMKRVTNKEVIGIKAKNFNITQKGGNYNNIGASVSASSILGGSKNRINGGSHNVIIAGSQNTVDCGVGVTVLGGEINTARGNYTTILGGKNNTVEGCSSSSSVIAGGSNNTLKGQNSVVVGTNNRVVGSNSVAMGKNSKVEASNSFLWTDGNQNGVLNSGNVFAVVSEHGMVVNTNKAHNFAKLTIGGSLVLYGDDHGNFAGLGGGKIKVVNGDSNYKCFCSYDGEKWNSLFGKGTCNYYCNNGLSSLDEPKCGTQVYKICTDSMGERKYYYSGTCEKGKVVEGTGAYILDKENKVHWTCQTDDGKIKKCELDPLVQGSCGATSKCSGRLPDFAELNNPIAVADGGVYHFSETEQSACAYHCKENFHINGNICDGDTRTATCVSSELPTNAERTKGDFQQKWNGKYWYPIVKKGIYNVAGSVECSFKCKDNYTWDGTRCVANRGTANCTGNPTNSSWVSGTFRQIWGGNTWKPASIPARHISNNSIDCYYKCDSSHVRNGSDCSCPASASFGQSCCKETSCTNGTFCSNSYICEECTNYDGICRGANGEEGICQKVNGAGKCSAGTIPPAACPTGRTNLAYGTECCTNEDSCHHTTETSNGKLIESGCMPTSSSSLGGICGECFVDADCMNKGYGPDKTKCQNYECISVTPSCNIPTAGFGEACCETTQCLDSVGDSGAPHRFCSNREICEECTNYGGRCDRRDGKGLCIRATDSSAGECVACFEENQSFDPQQGRCVTARCGSAAGGAFQSTPNSNLCAVGTATSVQWSNGKYTWQCKVGDTNHGISTVSCDACKPAKCGAANGSVSASNPNYGLCDVGEASEVQGNGTSYTWKCVSCSSTVSCGGTVSATCGTANGKTHSARPSNTELCSIGSVNSKRIEGGKYKWYCVNGGSVGSCSAFQTPTCGSSNGQIFSSKPSSNLCGIGTSSTVSEGTATYTWSCTNGDSTAQCSATIEAKCGSSNGQIFGDKPTTNLCEKGSSSTVRDNGTSFTWSCTNGSSVKPCSATKGCNIATAGNGEACCSTANGDPMNTVCRPDKTENNDYKCFNSHKVCEECDNYGGRCSRPYYTQHNLGQGLCIKHENSGKPFGECVACFSPYETFDMNTGKCGYVDCGDTEGSCKYCTIDGATGIINCSNFTASSSNGSWTCSKGNASVNGRSSKTCTLPDPEPILNSDITMEWIDYYDYHGDKHQKNSIDKLPINVVAELAFFKNGNYISDGNTVIGKYGSTNIKLNDITWSTPYVSSYSSDVNSNGNVSKYWMTLKDASVVPWQGTTTVYFEGKYNGKTLISESVTEWFYKAEASCKVDNGNILGKWFNASGKICSA